jgi:para-nitrobenzyl esterase
MNAKRILTVALGTSALLMASSQSWAQDQAPQGGRGGAGRGAGAAGAPQRGGGAARDPLAGIYVPTMADPEKGPVIKVAGGEVRGILANDTETYMDIPFAAPPVGDLRWRSPKPAAPWKGVRDGQKPSATCAAEEDCLYLNVWRPAGIKPGAKLPVMMWIYGGSFTGGYSMGAFGANHDGTEFAHKGVITVTINYRLGRAGWFSHPALTKEGQGANFGLEDQIAALKWIRANIGAVGGDTKNVTIFGESAGAMSVLTLMSSPPAQGLFQKAISESGFPRYTPEDRSKYDAMTAAAAAKVGITGDDEKAAAALRKQPLTIFPASTGTSDPTRPYPIKDDKFVLGGPVEMFAKGKEAKIPLIVGGNSDEASLYRPQAADWAKFTDKRAQMLSLFQPAGVSDVQAVNDYVTTQRMTESDRDAARLHTKNGSPSWTYFFSYVTPAQRPTTLGAIHVAEIPYAWNSVPKTADPQDLSTAESMNAYWAAFAKYGNPGAAGGPKWDKYDGNNDHWIEFTYNGTRATDHMNAAKLDFVEQQDGSPSALLPPNAVPATR